MFTPCITIAIAGASGSGKSTLTSALLERFPASMGLSAVALPLDAYYRDLTHLSFEARDQQNFDHPSALELSLYAEHLQALRLGQPIEAPRYDFSTHSRCAETQPIAPADVLIAEGIFTLIDPNLRALFALTVFVETPLETCLGRRINRDKRERGRDEASVKRFWFERVLPMFNAFGGEARAKAQVIVDGTASVDDGVAAIFTAVSERSTSD